MKRVFSLFLVLLLVAPLLLIGVSAAETYEPERYEFYYRPSISMLDDFEFDVEGDGWFLYEGFLPSGRYHARFVLDETRTLDIGMCDIVYYEMVPGEVYYSAGIFFIESGEELGSYEVYFESDGINSATAFFVQGSFGFDVGWTLVLERIGDVPGDSVSLSDELSTFISSLISSQVYYSTGNLILIFVSALLFAASPAICWFAYRFIKGKLVRALFHRKV